MTDLEQVLATWRYGDDVEVHATVEAVASRPAEDHR